MNKKGYLKGRYVLIFSVICMVIVSLLLIKSLDKVAAVVCLSLILIWLGMIIFIYLKLDINKKQILKNSQNLSFYQNENNYKKC
jgi:hypothetical protein